MLGHSFKLMGLATMNIFIALALSSTLLQKTPTGDIQALTEQNVGAFVTDVTGIAAGKKTGMDQYAVTSYLMDHVTDSGIFKSIVRYNFPDMPDNERQMAMDKKSFISSVLEDMRKTDSHAATFKIEYIKVNDSGRTATAITTNYEHSTMPVSDAEGGQNMMPVYATTYCEQTVLLNNNRIMQLAAANCTTDVALNETN
jgi:hypothetical protein